MKQIVLALILIAALASLGVGGTFAHWVESDTGAYSFQANEWQVDLVGSHGWWKNWPNHLHLYPNLEADINFWLNEIDGQSDWLMLEVDGIYPINTADMVLLIAQGEGSTAEQGFLMQYLAQRLNQMSGRQSPSSRHDVTEVLSYATSGNYLDLVDPSDAPGWEILQKIEAKHGAIELLNPDAYEFEIMKDVCDALNNLLIKLD